MALNFTFYFTHPAVKMSLQCLAQLILEMGSLLPAQPLGLGSCWYACCCGLMCHRKEVLLFHWEVTCIGRADATYLWACRRGGPPLQLNWEAKHVTLAIEVTRPAQWCQGTVTASSITVKMPTQQHQKHPDNNNNITHINVIKHFIMSHVDVESSLRWLSASTSTVTCIDIILTPKVTQNPKIWTK
jgi:hypothetical protein